MRTRQGGAARPRLCICVSAAVRVGCGRVLARGLYRNWGGEARGACASRALQFLRLALTMDATLRKETE